MRVYKLPIYHPFLKFVKTIRLPEYDYIGITELEESLIDNEYFQRLRRIRQSPGVYMVFPGSSHTRFEHSIGAMHIADRASTNLVLNNMNHNQDQYLPIVEYFKDPKFATNAIKQVQVTRIAALLHDIGHAPLSHTFETFLKFCEIEDWQHEHLSIEIIYKKLSPMFDNKQKNPYDVDVRSVLSLLCDLDRKGSEIHIQKKTKDFLCSLGLNATDLSWMDNFLTENWFLNHIIKEDPFNVDRFNYMILDSRRSGAIEYGTIDVERLCQNLYIHNQTVSVSTKAREAALRFFEAYSQMYKTIYQHKVAYGADLHLAYTMFLASESSEDNIFKRLRQDRSLDQIVKFNDDVLLYFLREVKDVECKRLIDDYLKRNILSMAYQTQDEKFQDKLEEWGKEKFQSEIKKKANLDKEITVLIVSITDKKAAKRPLTEETLRRVSFYDVENDDIQRIDDNLILTLAQKKTYRVYTLHDTRFRDSVRNAVISLLN